MGVQNANRHLTTLTIPCRSRSNTRALTTSCIGSVTSSPLPSTAMALSKKLYACVILCVLVCAAGARASEATAGATSTDKIKHIVVLMLENRFVPRRRSIAPCRVRAIVADMPSAGCVCADGFQLL